MCYTKRQIDNRVKQIKQWEAEIKERQQWIADTQQDVKDNMDGDAVITDHWAVAIKPVVRMLFDTKAFKASYEDMYVCFLKESRYEQFVIKEVKK